MIKLLKKEGIDILKIYYCPHNDLDKCNCKKPKTGMITNALNDFDIDLTESFYIGDNYNDFELAKKVGLDFYGIIGKNNDNIFKFNNILEIINEREK